jgi:CRP/FNR family transcriptional regulator, nitrogen fixation regulation protein
MQMHTSVHSLRILNRDDSHREAEGSSALDRGMLRLGVVISFSRNEEIFTEDEPADHLHKVIDGTVCTYKILSDGRRHISEFYLAGECFGLKSGVRHSLSAETITDARILVVKKAALMALGGSNAAVVRELLALTAFELARAQGRTLLLAKTAEERVSGFLLEMASRSLAGDLVELPMLRQDIADYLGLTIETVSRTLRTLKEHAAIEVSHHGIVLRNRSLLNRLNG